MGAKSSTIVYRRDKSKIPARQIELQEALLDGAKIIYNTRVINANIENEKIIKINCIKTDTSGENVVDIPNTEYTINADTVVFAIGLKPDKELIQLEGIKLSKSGLIDVDVNYMTNIKGVFAGGDVIRNEDRTVCRAIEQGKKAAIEIDKYLKIKENT